MRAIIGLSALLAVRASPPVQVLLRSSWPAPSFLVEMIETIGIENPSSFFHYLDRVTDPETLLDAAAMSPEAIHQYTLDIAVEHGFLTDAGALSITEINLALHAATPKIEAFYQSYVPPDVNCGSWVDWYGTQVCDIETLVHLAGVETIDGATTSGADYPQPKLFSFDHVLPISSSILERPLRTAILYADLMSPNFRELHTYLLSRTPHVEYVLRYIPDSQSSLSRNILSGYSVALDLKKMDYLAVDDRYQNNGETGNSGTSLDIRIDSLLALIETHPENKTVADSNAPLTEDEISDLGLKATQIIMESPESLLTLKQLSQDFPRYATFLARRAVTNENISDEIHANQLLVQGGTNAFWLNGITVADKDVTPFGMLRLLRKERSMITSLSSLGLTSSQAIDLVSHPDVSASQSEHGAPDGLVDASDRKEGGNVIVWWNDIEKDSRYARWNPSLHLLMSPMYPGQFPSIKLNLFNVVLLLDLSQTTSLNFIAGTVSNIIERGFPFRFGVVPLMETEEGRKMGRLFYYIVDTFGRKRAMSFLRNISQLQIPIRQQIPTVQWNTVQDAFIELCVDSEDDTCVDVQLDGILKGEKPIRASVEISSLYAARLGATLSTSPLGHGFINGKHYNMGESFLRSMQIEVQKQLQHLQERLYEGAITNEDGTKLSSYFYDLPGTSQRRNRHIIPGSEAGSLRIFGLPEALAQSKFLTTASSYIYSSLESVPLTIYVIADLDSGDLSAVKHALEYLNEDAPARVTFVHNPKSESAQKNSVSQVVSRLISTDRLSSLSPSQLMKVLGISPNSDAADNAQEPLVTSTIVDDILAEGRIAKKEYDAYLLACKTFLNTIGIDAGDNALVINGRVIGPFNSSEFLMEDFKALETYEMQKRVQPVVDALTEIKPEISDLERHASSSLIAFASSVIAAMQIPDPSEVGLFDSPHRARQRNYKLLDADYSSFQIGDNTTAIYQIAVLLDPLSETAQRWSSILEWLSNIPDTSVEVHLNPSRSKENPLKRFFRYNLLPTLKFDENGYELPARAIFEGLPIEPIYTLAMDVPTSWLVRPREALYDLDNIQLGALSPEDSSVDAIFDLDFLVVEGHARDPFSNAPPRGVQLELVNSDGVAIDDTQVVANLGYFQFKAKPGVFRLDIRSGRGREIFEMDSVGNDGWNSPTVKDGGREITLTSFEGLTLYPRLSRKPGMENADVLIGGDDASGEGTGIVENVASWVKSLFGSPNNTDLVVASRPQADINIFTVASGLLYERFVGIMILSVLRNTNSTVKFWFIENFLSTSFLEFIPHFAEAYGFQYELVTYKWPSWLRAQKEKQRIIWAYKILFLDVLFPMDLKKVIFVDADQIVRADLKELVDLDLHGAPYGYTPMGDDNYQMEGFRFWKTGYWKDFLQGRPYHISALYVVDLVRFRQGAAGDILRGQYQQLSADPNSLANLDQDLPNNLQREVPIFSLPEDWLWCETWCSKDRLYRAKTIDLCQNPLTKEPKLARARQIPEWEEYDGEIARFTRELAKKGIIKSRIATADSNTLAGGAANSAEVKEKEEARESVRDEL